MGRDTKLPHFPFYARDWLTDEKVMLMGLSQQGAYIRLLCYQWLEGSIPRDPSKLAALCGCSQEEFLEHIWPSIDEVFEVVDKRLVNKRLDEIKIETQKRVDALSTAGKRGAEKRWGGHKGSDSPPDAIHSHSHIQTEDDDDVEINGPPNTTAEAMIMDELMRVFGFGHLKAMDIANKLKPTLDDLQAWANEEEKLGTRLTRHLMKRYKNPSDVPEEKEGTQRKTFSQMADDDYAKKKTELEEETEETEETEDEEGENDVPRNSEDA